MTQKPTKSHYPLYDLDIMKSEISILEVCRMLGIEPEKVRGSTAWCKARKERTASTKLNLERNTFRDFGGGTDARGSVIDFYMYVAGVPEKEAIQVLGKTFGIPQIKPRAGLDPNELTNYDWKQIGLHGDRATMNFTFNVDRTPIERICEISEQYAMPMNQLRKRHPKIYQRLLLEKAIPYVRTLKNEYLLSVYQRYRLAQEIGGTLEFSNPKLQEDLLELAKELQGAESRLTRALHGTGLTYHSMISYTPEQVLQDILQGSLKPQFGNLSHSQLKTLSRKTNSPVEYGSIPYEKYLSSGLEPLPHSGFLSGDRVVVGYLALDRKDIRPILDQYKRPHSSPNRSVPVKPKNRTQTER